ncbi:MULTISPECIES: FecR domain-containing protein [unclassified Sphingomonas]|jgi:transmembrane sensor|uniref:FecR family protein n=3 Tax=Pseudomonadota TaxID=1224 RepID=UPI0010F9322E|nr:MULTISPECIES: FecR domain-containing protein [unclassified Sphingomonas]
MKQSQDNEDAVNARARDYVLLLASGKAGNADLRAIRHWLTDTAHAFAFERERAFWQDLELHRGLFAEQTVIAPPARRGRRRIAGRWRAQFGKRAAAGAAVACLALALAGPDLALRLQADHMTGTGAIRTVTLADGSTAVLDSRSAIAVDYRSGERRVTLLRGRAWFNVSHGDTRPFRVIAAGGMTEDISTAFEVAREDTDAVEVAVSEGAVRVAGTEGGAALRLGAGDRVRYADGTAARIATVRTDRVAAWRHGELLIDRQPLAEAIAEVKRYRTGPVLVLANLDTAKPVSAVFRTDRPDDALAALAAGAGLRLTRLPAGTIIIR